MAAPSKNFTSIPDTSIDADSPIDTTLLTQIRDSLVHLEEWLGMSYTAAQDHDHDGVNSKLVTSVAAAAIAQGQLKTTTGSVSATDGGTGITSDLTLPGGEYGFYPQIKFSSTGSINRGAGILLSRSFSSWTTYATNITLYVSGLTGKTIYAQQRYIQASPPYKIGDTAWGHFLFVLRNVSTGEIISSYEAEDPPWAYNGSIHLPKDSAERMTAVPHPFADYHGKDPAVDGLEICLIDLCTYDTKRWKADNAKLGRGLLEDIHGGKVPFAIGAEKPFTDFGVPTIPGFTDKVKVRARI